MRSCYDSDDEDEIDPCIVCPLVMRLRFFHERPVQDEVVAESPVNERIVCPFVEEVAPVRCSYQREVQDEFEQLTASADSVLDEIPAFTGFSVFDGTPQKRKRNRKKIKRRKSAALASSIISGHSQSSATAGSVFSGAPQMTTPVFLLRSLR